MRKQKFFLVIFSVLLLLIAFWYFYLKDARENRLIKEGNALVEKIATFEAENNRLPTSLEEIGIEEQDEADALYYNIRDSIHFTVSFGTSLGESKFYYSDKKQWEDRYRPMK